VDSHRNYPPEEPDGQWYQRERGYPDPEWERRGGDPRYATAPGEAPYGSAPQYGDNPAYAETERYHVPEPRGGYQPDGEARYGGPGDTGDLGQATGRMTPVNPRSAEQLPPLPAAPQLPQEPGMAHGAPTSGLPTLGPEHLPPPDGLPPLAGPTSGPGVGDPGVDPTATRYSTDQIDRSALRRPSGGPGQLGDGVYRTRRPGTAAVLTVITVVFEVVALRLLGAALFDKPVSVGGSIASAFLVLGLPMFGLGLYGLLSGAAATPGAGGRVWLRTPLVYLPVALTLFLAAGLAA
jgi:hypothetical protein